MYVARILTKREISGIWVFSWLCSMVFQSLLPATEQTPEVRLFLKTYCVECHNKKADDTIPPFDTIDTAISHRSDYDFWRVLLQRVNRGEMPPPEADQPNLKELSKFTSQVKQQLRSAARFGDHRKTVLRRLNRLQYMNTVRDLVGVEMDVTNDFPEDPPAFGFDNIGGALTTSPLHMEKFVAAAREIIRRAILDRPKPVTSKWRFDLERATMGDDVWLTRRNRNGREYFYARIFARENKRLGDFVEIHHNAINRFAGLRDFFVPLHGPYKIRVRAAAKIPTRDEVVEGAIPLMQELHRRKLFDEPTIEKKAVRQSYWEDSQREQLMEHFRTDPIYDYGPARLRVVVNGTDAVGIAEVSNDISKPLVFEFPVQVHQQKLEIKINNDYEVPSVPSNFHYLRDDRFPRPTLYVDWLEIEGPLYDEWPPPSHRMLLGGDDTRKNDAERARNRIARFMRRAFRRNVSAEEVEQYHLLYTRARQSTDSFEQAIQIPFVAVLASADFLYQVETTQLGQPVSAYELASRLSYFLWNSMPDDRLFEWAESKQILEKDVLSAEVDRMLNDPKGHSFAKVFSEQWLGIRDLGAVKPDQRIFPHFDEHLLISMRNESVAYFDELLRNDRSILQFIQSDFTMLNERLARFYKIPHVRGDDFRRVDLDSRSRRGGVLTQASVLTVTSNGTRTSPVKRGVWILENILASPTASPPPDVGDIEPTVPGIDKATVRNRLEAHQKHRACAVCHRRIDPLGFGLENYNAIGQWRDQETSGYQGTVRASDPDINAKGVLPDGREFDGTSELQQLLLDDKDRFVRCFVKKMVIYALGRDIDVDDEDELDRIIEDMPGHGYSIRGLIKSIVTSRLFLHR